MGKGQSKAELSPDLKMRALKVFSKIDVDNSKTIDKQETLKFWSSNFAKLNADALFRAVDKDRNGQISCDEWIYFWEEVKSSGYSEEEIEEELINIENKGAWTDYHTNK